MFSFHTVALQKKRAPLQIGPFLLVSIVLLTLLSPSVHAQPKAIGPDDLNRLHQQTEFSGDWSKTNVFDLDQYVTIKVTLEGVHIPDGAGNAVLMFTTGNPQKLTAERDFPADYRFQATLQSADVVKFMALSERDFPKDVGAIVRGWPATERNITGSVLLVDDIQIVGNDKTFSLHTNNPKMKSKRPDTATPD